MTASTPPPDAPPATPPEAALLRAKLSAVESLLPALREDNRRLTAALAVERAARDPDELLRLRRDVHLVSYRLSRALRVFPALGLDPPDPHADNTPFVDDDFLAALPDRVAAAMEKRSAPLPPPVDHQTESAPPEQTSTPPPDKAQEPQEPQESRESQPTTAPQPPQNALPETSAPSSQTQSDHQPSVSEGPTTDPQRPKETLPAAPSAQTNVSDVPVEAPPVLVDKANHATEYLRMLIGADTISWHENPTRIKINMTNADKKRALSFWLESKKDVIEFTRESVQLEEDSCPSFLKEESIEFEVDQAPNFLVLVMGAMFDFTIEPKREPALEEDPPQEDESMGVCEPAMLDS